METLIKYNDYINIIMNMKEESTKIGIIVSFIYIDFDEMG